MTAGNKTTCPVCGTVTPEGESVCAECGATVPQDRKTKMRRLASEYSYEACIVVFCLAIGLPAAMFSATIGTATKILTIAITILGILMARKGNFLWFFAGLFAAIALEIALHVR